MDEETNTETEETKEVEVITDDEDRKKGRGGEMLSALIKLIVLSAAVIGVIYFILDRNYAIGPVLIIAGIIPLIVLKFSKKEIGDTVPDIVFGMLNAIILSLMTLLGINFADLLGAVIGAALGNAITIGLAGIFEGKAEEYLRKKGKDIERSPTSASLGKLSGCLFGLGIVLTIFWTILGIGLPAVV